MTTTYGLVEKSKGVKSRHRTRFDFVPSESGLSVTSNRTGKCFLVHAAEIRSNKYDLSISHYKQIEHKEIEYEKAEVIRKKVMNFEKEIAKDISEISGTLL